MDPMTAATASAGRAAGTLLAKSLQQNGRIRLGGREERRIVYAHFQVCVIRTFNNGYWLSGSSAFTSGAKALVQRAFDDLRALDEAEAELMLVGNARPVALGVKLRAAATAMDVRRKPGHRVNARVVDEYEVALAGFIRACREDLWYLPQWWQIWRPVWWRIRWEAGRERRKVMREVRAGAE
ncbi:hypothetical protein ACFVIZ_06445 [Streptomyces anulatus]|uniref:hypothetical protein n=1 Tax=Streptomyces anulatus TaxID=1892 RepID=UPI0036286199